MNKTLYKIVLLFFIVAIGWEGYNYIEKKLYVSILLLVIYSMNIIFILIMYKILNKK